MSRRNSEEITGIPRALFGQVEKPAVLDSQSGGIIPRKNTASDCIVDISDEELEPVPTPEHSATLTQLNLWVDQLIANLRPHKRWVPRVWC